MYVCIYIYIYIYIHVCIFQIVILVCGQYTTGEKYLNVKLMYT